MKNQFLGMQGWAFAVMGQNLSVRIKTMFLQAVLWQVNEKQFE
jgi:hypothetical protein